MSLLKIKKGDGTTESRKLSKDQPIAVGRHHSNDLQVDEDGVATLHCRISWTGKEYQVASANSAGVIVNNQLTFREDLKTGDTIRVGSLEIRYMEHDDDSVDHGIGLAAGEAELQVKPADPPKPAKSNETPDRSKDVALTGELIVEDVPPPLPKKGSSGKAGSDKRSERKSKHRDSLDSLLTEMPQRSEDPRSIPRKPVEKPKRGFFDKRPVRPGERDVSKSPIVLILGGGILTLLLVSLTLWFLIGRETATQAFDRGMQEFRQKRFSVSIERFQEFLKLYPRHDLAKSATAYTSLARIEQAIGGANPDWDQGHQLLEEFIRSIRDTSNFAEMQQAARELAERIASGAAENAGTQKKRELIQVSINAARTLEINSPSDQRPVEKLKQIEDMQLKAEQIIRRFDVITASIEKLNGELSRQATLEALQEYQKLVNQYPDSAADPLIAAAFQKILEVDRANVRTEEVNEAAIAEDSSQQSPQLLLVKPSRARADLAESGINTFAVIGSSCCAVDSGTGAIRWRRVIGSQTPFPPIPVISQVLCVLVFDTRQNELLLLHQKDGTLIWKLPIQSGVQGTPLIHEGRIIQPVRPSSLLQIDLSNGKLMQRVSFPQPIAGSPVLTDRDGKIVVAGNQQFCYLLNSRSLECIGVVQTGQRENAIQAPPLKMGEFVLLPQIDRADSTNLAVWDFSKEKPAAPVGTARVEGLVRDQIVLRGKQLFVPSSGERVTSFTVSDQPGTPLIARTAAYQVPNGSGSAIYLKPGPEDELWMASSLLQRLELSVDSIVPGGTQHPIGSATQPLQLVDQDLVVVGHPRGIQSFAMIAVDRRQMEGRWQLRWGGFPLIVRPAGTTDQNARILTDSGDLFEFSRATFGEQGVREIRPTASLPDQTKGYGGLTAVDLGKRGAFLAAAIPEPRWWLLNDAGQIAGEGALTEPPVCNPIPFGKGIVLPLKGKLAWLNPFDPAQRVEEYIMPQGAANNDRWIGLHAEDATYFIATTHSGRLSRFQLQSEPSPHLFEISHAEREATTVFPPRFSSGKIYIGAKDTLEQWTPATWEKGWTATLRDSVSSIPWIVGDIVIAESGANHLSAFHTQDGNLAWEADIDSSVAGEAFLWKERTIVPLRSGILLAIDSAGNITRGDCRTNLGGGHVLLEGELFLAADDGSWIRLSNFPEATP